MDICDTSVSASDATAENHMLGDSVNLAPQCGSINLTSGGVLRKKDADTE
jgi:hypothetical protein